MNNLNELQINYDNLLKLGYAVLDIRFKDYDFCPDSYKLVIARVDVDRDEFYQEMLKKYTSQEFKANEVSEIWTDMPSKWQLWTISRLYTPANDRTIPPAD